MNVLLATVAGWLLGSAPTAVWLARARGVDLSGGSGNPGANNAWRLGGRRLGAAVLLAEAAKGASAVALGWSIAGTWGAAAGGVGAAVGNILNPWLRFRGGQGLGIAAGILLAGWPVGFVIVLSIVGAITMSTRSTHRGAATGVVGMGILSFVELPTLWGLPEEPLRLLLLGLVTILLPKQILRAIKTRL